MAWHLPSVSPSPDPAWAPRLGMAAALFAGMLAAGLMLTWIIDPGADPGTLIVVGPALAVVGFVASRRFERSPAVPRRSLRDLGETARAFALAALLLSGPVVMIHLVLGDPGPAVADGWQAEGVRDLDAACPAADVPRGTFADLGDGSHAPAVRCIGWWGLAQGSADGHFVPTAPATRAQTVTLIGRLSSAVGLQAASPGADSFGADGSVTRGQAVTFVVGVLDRASGGAPAGVASDAQAGAIDADVLDRAVAYGLVDDRSGRFEHPVTRGQLASLLARALDAAVTAGAATVPGD